MEPRWRTADRDVCGSTRLAVFRGGCTWTAIHAVCRSDTPERSSAALLEPLNGLINKISTLRRDLFTNLLTKRYELTDAIGKQVITDVVTEGQTLRQRVAAALRFAFKFKFSAVMTATFLALLVALVVHFIGKYVFGRDRKSVV